MDETASLLLGLALVLIAARISSEATQALRLPGVFGVLLAGVLLGPGVANLIPPSAALSGMAGVGVVLLLFVAGLETDLVQMRRVGLAATLAAVGGVALPMAGAYALARWFGYGTGESLFIGTILTATSVTVSAQVLREIGYLQSRVGTALLGAAIIDDIVSVVVLTVVVSMEAGGSLLDLLRLAAFIPVALAAGLWITRRVVGRFLRTRTEERFIEVLALVLAFAWAAEALGGLAAISGAYLAGVLFGRTALREELAAFGNLIGYALFAPVFFVTTGMMTDVGALAQAPLFTALLLLVAIATKVVGAGAGALAGRFSLRESLAVGAGMVSRGEVAIVIAVLGRHSGVIGEGVFATSVVVTLLTTMVAPLLLRLTLPGLPREPEDPADAARRRRLEEQIARLES